MSAVKLVVEDLEMMYDDKKILNKLNFEVYDGEFFSILGTSGCGKTTLLRILVGLVKSDSGKIYKNGKDITNLSPSQREMGIVFQNYALFENMTVLDNIEYALKIRKENRSMNAKKNVRNKVLSIIKRMGLSDHINKKPIHLSGGQQQRVAIARTLVMNPDIVLFDEPMSALDKSTQLVLRKELKSIQEEFGTTIIYVTHDQEEAFAVSDRIMIMSEGNIIQVGTPREIVLNPNNEFVESFVIKNFKIKSDFLLSIIEGSNNYHE